METGSHGNARKLSGNIADKRRIYRRVCCSQGRSNERNVFLVFKQVATSRITRGKAPNMPFLHDKQALPPLQGAGSTGGFVFP